MKSPGPEAKRGSLPTSRPAFLASSVQFPAAFPTRFPTRKSPTQTSPAGRVPSRSWCSPGKRPAREGELTPRMSGERVAVRVPGLQIRIWLNFNFEIRTHLNYELITHLKC